ncbi:MAG: hypothetical protein ACK40K_06190, partial [Raineya sp.]
MKKLYLLFIIFLICKGAVLAQKSFSYEKEFFQIEKKYEKGKYKKALRKLKSKEKSSDKTIQTFAYLYKAKIYEAQGLMQDMEASLNQAVQNAEILQASSPQNYATYLVKLAELYEIYGSPAKSLSIIEASSNQALVAQAPPVSKAEWLFLQGKSNLSAGNFAQSEVLFDKALKHYDSLLSDTKINRLERETIKKQKARLLTQKALVYTQKGEYEKADSLLQAYKKPVRQLTSVVDMAYIEHLIAFAQNREAQEQYRTANQYYKMGQRANEYYDFAFSKNSKGYFHLQEGIVRNNIRSMNNIFGYGLSLMKLKKETKRYFPKNSIYDAYIVLLEVEHLMQKRNYPKALNKISNLLSNDSKIYLPKDHKVRAKATKYLAQLYTKTPSITNQQVEKTYQDWLSIEADRYSQHSFYYQISELELANYYVVESENFLEGK